jgi:chemotaxis protein CheD
MARLVIGIGDCKVSKDPSDVLVTHALGSCIAVLLYDPRARVAGLLHYMLPESSLDPKEAGKRPYLFADTGIPLLLHGACQLGAVKSRMVIVAAGGARMLNPTGTLNVGQRNHLAMLKIFEKAGIRIYKEDIGGTCSRTVSIDVAHGRVQLQTPGHTKLDLFGAEGNSCHR